MEINVLTKAKKNIIICFSGTFLENDAGGRPFYFLFFQ